MLLSRICCLLLCSLSFAAAAQTSVTDTIFFDRAWNVTADRDTAAFFRMPTVKTDSGWRIADYFRSGQLQMLEYATNESGVILTGYAVHYDSAGHKTYEGTYYKGMRHGIWIIYYPGGWLKDSLSYDHSEISAGASGTIPLRDSG